MDFQYPYLLLLLLFVPILLLLFRIASRQNVALRNRFGDWAVFQKLVPDFDPRKSKLKFYLILTAFIFLVIAIANPRIGTKSRKVKKDGIDIYIALDISRSMWARDVNPRGLDRLEKSRLMALKLIEEFKGNRIGLIFFAGDAFIQMPLTLDYAAAQLFLNEGLGDFEINQGTALDKVIELSTQYVSTSAIDDKPKQKALVILSDGEDHEKKAVKSASNAKSKGVHIYCIGVGEESGSPIPLEREEQAGTHTDKKGNIVETKADKAWLKNIASAGNGKFFDVEEGNLLVAKLKKEFEKIEKEEYNEVAFDEYQSYFQLFIFLSLVLLMMDFLTTYRNKNRVQKNTPIKNGTDFLTENEAEPLNTDKNSVQSSNI